MKILNYGSLNYDKVYQVPHFVQEGETLLSLEYQEFLGGKGLNQSLALARAGAEVYHAGAVGRDGQALMEVLEQSGVNTQYLQQLDGVSGHAIIQKCNGLNCIIVFGGANQQVTRPQLTAVLDNFGEGDLLLLQNETSNVDFAITQAKKRGMLVAFNASPITPALLKYPLDLVDYFLVNEVEGKALAGENSEDFHVILDALAARFPNAHIVLTIGSNGVLYRDSSLTTSHKCYPVEVADTTAAGDTFTGYFLASLARGYDIDKCLATASMAGAISVSRNGASTSIPTMEEVAAFAKQNT